MPRSLVRLGKTFSAFDPTDLGRADNIYHTGRKL